MTRGAVAKCARSCTLPKRLQFFVIDRLRRQQTRLTKGSIEYTEQAYIYRASLVPQERLMKKVALVTAVCVAMFAALGAGPEGQKDIAVLEKLGFELVVPKKLMPGAPQQLKVTKKTLEKLEELMKAGKGVAVSDGGELEIVVIEK